LAYIEREKSEGGRRRGLCGQGTYSSEGEGGLGHFTTDNDGAKDKGLGELCIVTLKEIADDLDGILFKIFFFILMRG